MDKKEKTNDKTTGLDEKLKIMEVVENELERQKGEALFCLMFFSCCLCSWILFVALWEKLGKPFSEKYMTIGVELIAAIMLIVVLKFTRLDIKKMGITKKNLKGTFIRDSVISLILVILMIAVKLAFKPDEPLLNLSKFDPTYTVTSVVQEFLARGFLVSTLMRINNRKSNKHVAVVCSSLMFTSLHLYYGFSFMVGAGLLSVLLGYCYLKDENIWGVSLIHFVFGTVGVMMELV